MKILKPGESCTWKDRKQGVTCCTTEKVSDTIPAVEPNVPSFYDNSYELRKAWGYGQCFDKPQLTYIGCWACKKYASIM